MTLLDAKRSKPMMGGPSFSFKHRLFRAIWNGTWLLTCSWTPAPLFRWRLLVLTLFGAKVHRTARVYGSARVWYPPNLVMHAYSVIGPNANCYCMDEVVLGEMVVVSQNAFLCAGTHDIGDPDFQLVTRPISIGARAWVAADAFVGPGVKVGEGSVLGARAVLFKDAAPWGVYVGNPAILVRQRQLRDRSVS